MFGFVAIYIIVTITLEGGVRVGGGGRMCCRSYSGSHPHRVFKCVSRGGVMFRASCTKGTDCYQGMLVLQPGSSFCNRALVGNFGRGGLF